MVVTLLVVTLSIAAATSIVSMIQVAIEEHQLATSNLARSLSLASAEPVARRDASAIKRLTDAILEEHPNVAFVALRDIHGEILAVSIADAVAWHDFVKSQESISPTEGPRVCDGYCVVSTGIESPLINPFSGVISSRNSPWSEARTHVGSTVVALSAGPVVRGIWQRSMHVLVLFFAIAVGSIPVVWIIAGGWSRRLRTLVDAADAVASGDFETPLRDLRTDEVAQLTKSFDDMRQSLGQRDREMNELNQNLNTLVEQRTDELRQRTDQLEHALEAAHAASEAKSMFLANMSHEIRTPMNAILGYTDILCDEDSTPAERSAAQATINRCSDHLLTVINDILDISKLEAGRVAIERREFNLAQLMRDVVALHAGKAKEKGLTLSFNPTSALPETIVSDRVRLMQVLINLISNAIKFTSTGSVTLSCRAFPSSDSLMLEFRVIDTGIGINASQQKQLFQPFTQADETMTRRYGGTGLGLAISRQLAILLGGGIEIESAEGIGSTFIVSIDSGLPADATLTGDIDRRTPTRPSVPVPCELAGHILLAEDGLDNQRLISHHLRKAGLKVTIAGNGAEALDAVVAAKTPFDLILMDMQMPVLDGYDATRTLRRQQYQGPIVALTAHAMDGDREKCLSAGCNEYATKPISKSDLLALCVRHMEHAQREAA